MGIYLKSLPAGLNVHNGAAAKIDGVDFSVDGVGVGGLRLRKLQADFVCRVKVGKDQVITDKGTVADLVIHGAGHLISINPGRQSHENGMRLFIV